MKQILYFIAAFLTFNASAAQFKYNELMLKDYDEMLQLVNTKLKQARSAEDQDAIEHLREVVKLILSRPDSDNMVAKLMPEVRKELTGYNAYEDVLSGLTAEELAVAKDDKAAPSVQATAIFVLGNLLAQIKPEVGSNADLRRIAERIKSAKLTINSGVKKDLKLRGMFSAQNPSEAAADILKSTPLKEAPKKETKPKSDED